MEFLLTQLLLEGSFTQLPAADIAALLSCFVLESRTSDATHDEQSTSLAKLLTVLSHWKAYRGNVVRGLLRLDELLRHIRNACHRLVDDQALGLRMNDARMAVHRDLVCAPSLYISEDFTCKPDTSL
ncbi:hypothetical protein PHET_12015 [Paragonimus heterotremus]|uniref:ATP-dependent RNA helicase Ski2/MTR4 C-terminal domain-containing protein n=1 Tax=Paragonimus heterotremus TaxID=100268 RepID=A0A8J4WDH6_9TREM|nr:hypothetical protein PHET_12015 [Paragonimus heterotremus]